MSLKKVIKNMELEGMTPSDEIIKICEGIFRGNYNEEEALDLILKITEKEIKELDNNK